MTEIDTHLGIDRRLCGTPLELEPDRAVVELTPSADMAADARGLVHGGFVFGLADYAAMLAVNHPNVVLAGAKVEFKAPIVVGERVRATAHITERAGKRATVEVEVTRGDDIVFTGTFHTATPSGHVLDRRPR
jgi:acyl-coenzyme A thioesterase PaaI-like protein